MVAKNGEFFSQPILGRDINENDAQRPGIAEGVVFEKRPPSHRTSFWKLFFRLTKLPFWNGRHQDAAW